MPRATKSATRKAAAPPSDKTSAAQALSSATTAPRTRQGSADVTATPYSSEGPTLPILGAGRGHVGGASRQPGQEEERLTKKRRTEERAPGSISTGTDMTRPTDSSNARQHEQERRENNAQLYEPWVLLPASLREMLAARLAAQPSHSTLPFSSSGQSPSPSEQLKNTVVTIAFTKNQNVKSGVNRLRASLLDAGKTVLAVSAQGAGTTKLVGIVELVKRVARAPARDGSGAGEEADVHVEGKPEEWYMYTVLTSREEARERRGNPDDIAASEDEEDGAFESLADIQERDRELQRSTRKVPVLTIWFSRIRIEGFKDVYGEDVVMIAGGSDQ